MRVVVLLAGASVAGRRSLLVGMADCSGEAKAPSRAHLPARPAQGVSPPPFSDALLFDLTDMLLRSLSFVNVQTQTPKATSA